MPDAVLIPLILAVAPYVLLVVAAASRAGLRGSREASASATSNSPFVSVVVSGPLDTSESPLQDILDAEYPSDHLEIMRVHSPSAHAPADTSRGGVHIRTIQISQESRADDPVAALRAGVESARGDVVLLIGPECHPPSTWIESMTRRCTPATPLIVGPALFEHEDLFLPRLQALQRLGRVMLAVGLQPGRIPNYGRSNLAVRRDAVPPNATESTAAFTSALHALNADVHAAQSAAVMCPAAASSFWTYLGALSDSIGRALRAESLWTQITAHGIWLSHLVLLAACTIAVAVPAWRQPVLLLLLAKMGGDVALCVTAARRFRQRTLTRSIVPSELMLVLSVPIAGLLALANVEPPSHW